MSFHHLTLEADESPVFTEVTRIAVSPELARNMVDAMCKNANYYPTKPDEPEKPTEGAA